MLAWTQPLCFRAGPCLPVLRLPAGLTFKPDSLHADCARVLPGWLAGWLQGGMLILPQGTFRQLHLEVLVEKALVRAVPSWRGEGGRGGRAGAQGWRWFRARARRPSWLTTFITTTTGRVATGACNALSPRPISRPLPQHHRHPAWSLHPA